MRVLPDFVFGSTVLVVLLTGSAFAASQVDLNATSNFTLSMSGFVPYQVDKGRRCVEIDATKYKNKWAAAESVFKGQEAIYKVALTVYLESDGESSYKLYIDAQQIGSTIQNPRVKKDQDHTTKNHIWQGVKVKSGSKIQIQSNTNSNQLISEGSGYAWARGKWLTLSLIPATTGITSNTREVIAVRSAESARPGMVDLRGRQILSRLPGTNAVLSIPDNMIDIK